jgi:glycosyltransferase involved in cell wall biosynthesis
MIVQAMGIAMPDLSSGGRGRERPAVSVILPIYNAGQFLQDQVDSILSQTYLPTELLLVDDGSTDESPVIAQRYADQYAVIRFQRNETNRGLLPTVNEVINQVDGDLIAFSDHDDVWMPDKIARQVAYLVAHPEVVCVFSDRVIIDREGHELCTKEYKRIGTPPEIVDTAFLLNSMARYTHANTLIFRKHVKDSIFPIPSGWDWWIGTVASWFGPVAFMRDPLTRYRVYEGSVSDNQRLYLQGHRSRTTRAQVQASIRRHVEYTMALRERAQQLTEYKPPLSLIDRWWRWYKLLLALLSAPTWQIYRSALDSLPTINRRRHLFMATIYALPPIHKAYLGLAAQFRGY